MLAPVVILPAVKVKALAPPVIFASIPFKETPVELIVTLLNVVAVGPFICWVVPPLKVTLPAAGTNVPPLLVQLPVIFKLVPAVPDTFRDCPALLIIILLKAWAAEVPEIV
jgi:hypothetical protein